jgi:hypothetical protein
VNVFARAQCKLLRVLLRGAETQQREAERVWQAAKLTLIEGEDAMGSMVMIGVEMPRREMEQAADISHRRIAVYRAQQAAMALYRREGNLRVLLGRVSGRRS